MDKEDKGNKKSWKDRIKSFFKGISSKSESEKPIIINNPFTKKEGFVQVTYYHVAVEGISDNFLRKYADFYNLRKYLAKSWNGIYVPKLPPKTGLIKNLKDISLNNNTPNDILIKYRMVSVEKFFTKIWKKSYFRESPQIQKFFEIHKDYKKTFKKIPEESYKDLLKKYKSNFNLNYENYDFRNINDKVEEFQKTIMKLLANYKEFLEKVENTIEKKQSEIESTIETLKAFPNFERYSLQSYDKDENRLIFNNRELSNKIEFIKENISNPLTTLNEFLQDEILDFHAILECLEGIMKFNDKKEKLKKKKNYIENPNDSKLSITEIIKDKFQKPQTEEEKEKKIDQIDKDIVDLDEILKITSYKILSESDEILSQKLKNFNQGLQLFIDHQIKFNITNKEIWRIISNESKEKSKFYS